MISLHPCEVAVTPSGLAFMVDMALYLVVTSACMAAFCLAALMVLPRPE